MEEILDQFNLLLQTRKTLTKEQLEELRQLNYGIIEFNNNERADMGLLLRQVEDVGTHLNIDVNGLLTAVSNFKNSNVRFDTLPLPGVPGWIASAFENLDSALEGLYSEIYEAKEVVKQSANVQSMQRIREDFLTLKRQVEALEEQIEVMSLGYAFEK